MGFPVMYVTLARAILIFLFPYSLLVSASSLVCDFSGSEHVRNTTELVLFLVRVQSTALKAFGPSNFDPKLYVDLSLKFNLSITEQAFNNLPRNASGYPIPVIEFQRFIDHYLEPAGSDLTIFEPPDYVNEPEGFLPKVESHEARVWSLEVHSLWKNLSRRVADDVIKRPDFHTLLPLPMPVVVPGSRFREVYYWDSYWIVRGLLVSNMFDTARSIINNLISLIDMYGYVLNGARAYYSNRSQPPLLSSMISDIYRKIGDVALVKRAFPALLKEHNFWTSGMHKVVIQDPYGKKHVLSRYYAMWNTARPESSTLDEQSAAKILNHSAKKSFFREVASTAESGWDFSSRWMRNKSDITTLATTSIVPVDLNVYILKMEIDITFFARILGEESVVKNFTTLSQSRYEAIKSVFWNDDMGQWFDYWLDNNKRCKEDHIWDAQNQNKNIFISNFVPLWVDMFHSDTAIVERVYKTLQTSGLIRPAGIATSLSNTGQQWDYPNGWAPMQHLVIEGLVKSHLKEAKALAKDIARRWIRTNYEAYKRTGELHEKYDVEVFGEFGGGGEYIPQTGFGWTNGVVLALLEEFGWAAHDKLYWQ